MEVVIYMAAKACRAMEPWARTNKDTAGKPFRAAVAIGSTGIGRHVIVAVWALRGDSDVDGDLGMGFRGCREGDASYDSKRKIF
jgi:hypothetical protein